MQRCHTKASDSSEISIDGKGRDRMKDRRGDILPKTKWMVKMDCGKQWKELATSSKRRGKEVVGCSQETRRKVLPNAN